MTNTERVAWVDYAKGLCIILVVMMHSVNNYEALVRAEGWLSPVADFARPFRMPAFFAIAGLFLRRSINGPLVEYVDRKVVHFAYFYLLWLAIQLGVMDVELLAADPAAFGRKYLGALVEPVNTLWFVHMLAVFYVVTRLVRAWPKWLVLTAAAGLQTAYQGGLLQTGWSVADEFCNRYVFFFAGYALAPAVFAFARRTGERPTLALCGLAAWGVANGVLVAARLHEAPLIGLALGFAGGAAVVAGGALVAGRGWAEPIRYAGANSIVIYLTFFLPMQVAMKALQIAPVVPDVGAATATITAVSVVAPLVAHRVIRDTPLGFLYRRPRRLRLAAPSLSVASG